MIWLRALLFVLAVQVTAVVVVPYALAASGLGPHLSLGPARYAGLVPIALGAATILWCNYAFVARGRGTAAPYEPPRQLVAAGVYRYMRNPMYVGATLMVLGQAILTGAAILLAYLVVQVIGYNLFVRYYEEPRLRRRFGEAYARYCAEVPRWIPRRPRATT